MKILISIVMMLGMYSVGNCARHGDSGDPIYNIQSGTSLSTIVGTSTDEALVDQDHFTYDVAYDYLVDNSDGSEISAVLNYASNTYTSVVFSTDALTMGSGNIVFASSINISASGCMIFLSYCAST